MQFAIAAVLSAIPIFGIVALLVASIREKPDPEIEGRLSMRSLSWPSEK